MRDCDQRSLARRLCDGDCDASNDILAAYGGEFANRLRARYKNVLPTDMAEEAVLVSVARACRYSATFDPAKATLKPWIWAIVKHEAARIIGADWFRQRLHETGVAQAELAEVAFAQVEDFDEEDCAERDPQSAEFLHYLGLAIPVLSEKEQYIIFANARSSGGVPTKQLAADLGLADSTVRRYRAEGPRKLKKEMERLGYTGPAKCCHREPPHSGAGGEI